MHDSVDPLCTGQPWIGHGTLSSPTDPPHKSPNPFTFAIRFR